MQRAGERGKERVRTGAGAIYEIEEMEMPASDAGIREIRGDAIRGDGDQDAGPVKGGSGKKGGEGRG